jgi:hypothetical protein
LPSLSVFSAATRFEPIYLISIIRPITFKASIWALLAVLTHPLPVERLQAKLVELTVAFACPLAIFGANIAAPSLADANIAQKRVFAASRVSKRSGCREDRYGFPSPPPDHRIRHRHGNRVRSNGESDRISA